ncbi:MAG: hypothetical protein K2X81_00840, partial [Candidatus Obscuribacterales bacterium]|nr:hypothetical protein [Candidatus Obscuribacterales bacterium]
MTDSTGNAGALTHYRRLSWRNKLLEHKAIFVFFISAMLVGFLGGLFSPFIYKSVSFAMFLPASLLFGFALGAAGVFGARLVDRKVFGAMKAGIVAVEDRIISGDTKTQMEDLEKLVAGYLKLKRMEAADYYSKKLLDLSKSGGQQVMKLSDWLVTTECWVSSDAYQKGWNYKMVWLFETRGVLTLTPTKLD